MRIPDVFTTAVRVGCALGMDLSREGSRCVYLHPNKDAIVWIMEGFGDPAYILGRYLEDEGYSEAVEDGSCLVWRKPEV